MKKWFKRFTTLVLFSIWVSSIVLSFSATAYAATVPSGIIIPWVSTNASIPAGWSRVTNLDTYYIQGAATSADADLTTVNGNATHGHTAPSTTITQNSHTHTFSGGSVGASDCLSGASFCSQAHTHASATSNSATATNQATTPTISNNTSNNLPYVKVIFIQSDGTPTGIPNSTNAYAFFASDTLPTGWTRVQGNNYLLGADAGGDDAGGDGGGTGGSLTHDHAGSIQPTQNAHGHTAKNSAVSSASNSPEAGLAATASGRTHVHSVTLNNATATNQLDNRTSTATNHEPSFKKLNIISNGSGAVSYPDQVIALWGSTNASIPSNWARFTSMDGLFVKGANADGESNVTTGGTQTHQHTITFQPTQDAHSSHSTSQGNASTTIDIELGTGAFYQSNTHAHTWTVGSTTATNQSTAVTLNANTSESAYPPYKKIILVQYTEPAVGGGAVIPIQITLLFFSGLRRT